MEKKYVFFVSNNKMDGHEIEVHSLEELFDALKVARDEWGENHAHLEMLEEGVSNHLVAEVTIPFNDEGSKYPIITL